MKFLDNYLKKRIKELDEHPELNKNGKIFQIFCSISSSCYFYYISYTRVSLWWRAYFPTPYVRYII